MTHHKKLQNLKNELLLFKNNKVIANLSNYRLLDNEASLLKNVLYFAVPSVKLIKTNIVESFEHMCNFLTSSMRDKGKTGEIALPRSHLPNSYYSSFKLSVSTLKKHKIFLKGKN